MGTVMDIYQLVRDLIDEAKNQKNLELVDRLIEIKLALSEIEDENRDLKKRIEELEQSNIIEEDLELLPKGYYIRKSEKAEGKDIKYCAACWQRSLCHMLIQLVVQNNAVIAIMLFINLDYSRLYRAKWLKAT